MDRSFDWLHQAQGDLRLARYVSEGGYFEWSCFAAQQAAEKAVKGALQRLGAEAWGHSITSFLRELAKTHGGAQDLIEFGLELDKAYIPTRYPDVHQSGTPRDLYTKREAERLIDYASQIVEFSASIVSKAQ